MLKKNKVNQVQTAFTSRVVKILTDHKAGICVKMQKFCNEKVTSNAIDKQQQSYSAINLRLKTRSSIN